MSPPKRRTLLLTLDAFETLFHPRDPVPVQYAQVAHSFGLSKTLITPDRLKQSFKTTFKAQSAKCPNYGRDEALKEKYAGPRQWWAEVIRGSLGIALRQGQEYKDGDKGMGEVKLPDGLVKTLLDRFAGREAYELYPDVDPFFERLRGVRHAAAAGGTGTGSGGGLGVFDRVIVGVISNSDDRVPDILKSLGLTVGRTRADRDVESSLLPGFEDRSSSSSSSAPSSKGTGKEVKDIDLVITSYDAGFEKPHPAIFDTAKRQAQSLVNDSGSETDSSSQHQWTCVHVGDHYEKDYKAAIQAGWDGVFLPREEGQQVEGVKAVGSLVEVLGLLERYR